MFNSILKAHISFAQRMPASGFAVALEKHLIFGMQENNFIPDSLVFK